jgi:hypothetical protein
MLSTFRKLAQGPRELRAAVTSVFRRSNFFRQKNISPFLESGMPSGEIKQSF